MAHASAPRTGHNARQGPRVARRAGFSRCLAVIVEKAFAALPKTAKIILKKTLDKRRTTPYNAFQATAPAAQAAAATPAAQAALAGWPNRLSSMG